MGIEMRGGVNGGQIVVLGDSHFLSDLLFLR